MPTRRASTAKPSETTVRRGRPAATPEAREQEAIAAAYDLAEKQIRNGTASSQVITHFLKLGSSREAVEQERIRGEVLLNKAKIEALESNQKMEELYAEAIQAMTGYSMEEPPGYEEGQFD